LKNKLKNKNSAGILAGLEMCGDYANDRSAGIKMLLEYVAMIVPERNAIA
jgi:hypothetical protein